jgi:hypothetical protein
MNGKFRAWAFNYRLTDGPEEETGTIGIAVHSGEEAHSIFKKGTKKGTLTLSQAVPIFALYVASGTEGEPR